MPGTLLAKAPSTTTRPRLSRFTPAASSPSPSVHGTRPIATSTTSASTISAAPPETGSIFALSFLPELSTAVSLDDNLKVIPWRSSRRWNCLPTSASMPGRMRARNARTRPRGPSPPPYRAELEADDAGADHKQALRHLVEAQRAGRGHDALFVDVDAVEPGDVGPDR